MNTFRLFIDIPIDASSVGEAVLKGNELVFNLITLNEDNISKLGVSQINYRLGNDSDRQHANYFIIDDRDHASTKKTIIHYDH